MASDSGRLSGSRLVNGRNVAQAVPSYFQASADVEQYRDLTLSTDYDVAP
ncbi:hypothetical protein AB0M54_29975 [Actinoplanes sp. NPDC051470]